MNLLAKTVCIMAFAGCAHAGTLKVPLNLQVGAKFLWHLSETNNPRDLSRLTGARISQESSALKQLTQANRSLQLTRSSLEPSVDVVHQIPFSIDIGEQKVVYRLYSQTRGSKFYEVHILGKNNPPTIAGVRELDSNQVINLLAKRKIISIPQK